MNRISIAIADSSGTRTCLVCGERIIDRTIMIIMISGQDVTLHGEHFIELLQEMNSFKTSTLKG